MLGWFLQAYWSALVIMRRVVQKNYFYKLVAAIPEYTNHPFLFKLGTITPETLSLQAAGYSFITEATMDRGINSGVACALF